MANITPNKLHTAAGVQYPGTQSTLPSATGGQNSSTQSNLIRSSNSIQALKNSFNSIIPDHQKENVTNLYKVISESVDQLPTLAGIQVTIATVKDFASDDIISDAEWQEITAGINKAKDNLGVTPDEAIKISQAAVKLITDSQLDIPDEQWANLLNLKQVVNDSVDSKITAEDIANIITTFQEIYADDQIDNDDFITILKTIRDTASKLGISSSESLDILIAVHELVTDSRLPKTPDNLNGTTGNDMLFGKGGSDILLGTTGSGLGEIDILMGGAGSDTFILGTVTSVLYVDAKSMNPGLSDYALILDFNPKEDNIQLKGSAADYNLFAVNAWGVGIFNTKFGGAAELIGVLYGSDVANFDLGFQFV